MADLDTLFTKIDQTCSNIFLLDENLCLSNSLKVINTNVVNLSTSINYIQTTSNYLNKVYTLFSNNSAAWIEASNNVAYTSATWIQDFKTVTSLSGTWANEFALYYNTLFEIQDWKTNNVTYSTNNILNWLNVNFPVSNFTVNQIVSVYVNLYENYQFDLASGFKASYTHDCHVPNGGGTVTCNGQCGRPSRGCNHHGGKAGNGPCTNAYDGCSVTVTGGANVTCTCPGYGGKTLNVPSNGSSYNYYVTDRFCAKSVRVRYKYNNGSSSWSKI
jgi:hypothetical protein